MAAFQYNTITDAINHFRSYNAHLKKLEEIKQGKNKSMSQRSQLIDPKLEESKICINRYKLVNRNFLENEKMIGMQRETQSLINKLQEIEKGKHSSIPDAKKGLQCSSLRTLHEPFRRREEQRMEIENSKMLQRLIGARSQCNAKQLMLDYKKSTDYQKRMQKSTKNWDTIAHGMRGEGNTTRLPPIKSVQHFHSESKGATVPKSKAKKKEKPYDNSEKKPKQAEKNIPEENPAQKTLSSSKKPEEKTREAPQKVGKKSITSQDPENKSMNPPENSSSSQNPESHIQKPGQNSSSPQVESSPTAKPAKKEEDVGIEEIADYIDEDFEV